MKLSYVHRCHLYHEMRMYKSSHIKVSSNLHEERTR
jgi:hypothetical protein